MAASKGNIESEDYNSQPIVKGNQNVWFLNGDLVRPHHSSRSTGIVTFYNITKARMESCFRADFLKNREKAYTVGETAELVHRHKKYLPRLVKRGVIPPPVGSQEGGATAWQVRSYYSESHVKEIRAILAEMHHGRPRRDKLITNNMTPTNQELTRRMGEGILTYTRTEDGRFIPIWNETV